MSERELITKTADFMKAKFAQEPTGHDWWHLYRVWQLAKHIASKEKGANMLVVELAALGAIGIARLFTMSGSLGRPMHEPNPLPQNEWDEMTIKWGISSIQHFYDKLLLLKDRMLTKTGTQMAIHRHEYMEKYLKEFYTEWDGKL